MARDFTRTANDRYFATSWTAVTGTPLTMACWFQPDSSASSEWHLQSLHDFDAVELFGIGRQGSETGMFAGAYADNNWGRALTTNAWTLDQWNSVVGIYVDDGTVGRICVLNGDWDNRGTNADTKTPTGIDRYAIGAQAYESAYANHFNGKLAWATVWDTDLTQQEAEAFANGVNPMRIRRNNIVSCVPIDWEDGDTVACKDIVNHSHTWNANGTLTLYHPGPPVEPYRPLMWRGAYFEEVAAGGAYDPSAQLAAGELALAGSGGMVGGRII